MGVDIDVPLRRMWGDAFWAVMTRFGNNVSSALPGTRIDTMRRPGATRSGFAFASAVPHDENHARLSSRVLSVPASSVAPTVMAYGSMPGLRTVPRAGPLFPAAATTTSPRRHAISTAADSGAGG